MRSRVAPKALGCSEDNNELFFAFRLGTFYLGVVTTCTGSYDQPACNGLAPEKTLLTVLDKNLSPVLQNPDQPSSSLLLFEACEERSH